jgi:hypothetical protein
VVPELQRVLIGLVVGMAIVAVVRFEMFCLRDIADADEVRYLTKQGWIVLCLLWIPFGGILYLYYGRTR